MASLIKYKTAMYYIVYCKKGKRIWRSLRTKDRIEAYRLFAERNSLDPTATTAKGMNVESEFLSFLRANCAAKTVEAYQRTFHNIKKFLGKEEIQYLSARDIENYKTLRKLEVSSFTVNQELRCLRAFFNRLVSWMVLAKSPCVGVQELSIPLSVPTHLSQDNLAKLLEHTKGSPLHDVILFAAMTGLRRGEICNLTWKDVDLERGTILVTSSQFHRTKGGKIRLMPINSAVRRTLGGRSHSSEYVFPGDRGGRTNGNFLRARFKKSVSQCGLDANIHFHSLRHTFASLLVKDGVSLYHVQRLLGHSSPRVTQIYAHLGPAELVDTVERLSSLAEP